MKGRLKTCMQRFSDDLFNFSNAHAESLKFLVDSGMQFDPISPEVRAVLREKTKAVIDQVKAKVGDELVNAVLAEIAK